MEGALWYVLTGTRGGTNRVRLLHALDERPRNANQLAEDLDLDYKTVRHHLDVLMDNGIVENSGDDYGAVYLITDRTRQHWDTVEEIIDKVE
ncbi:winged helix-turn-helix domain-containing protein [Haladaptatus sp. NG-WS-4]